jgi:hypothetical protein
VNTYASVTVAFTAALVVSACDRFSTCDRPLTVKLEGQERASSVPLIGRYQAVVLPKGSSSSLTDSVFVLDTRDGDLWEWEESASMGAYKGGVFLRYMGHLTPGTAIGDVLQKKTY